MHTDEKYITVRIARELHDVDSFKFKSLNQIIAEIDECDHSAGLPKRELTYIADLDVDVKDVVAVPFGPVIKLGLVTGMADEAQVKCLEAKGVVFKHVQAVCVKCN